MIFLVGSRGNGKRNTVELEVTAWGWGMSILKRPWLIKHSFTHVLTRELIKCTNQRQLTRRQVQTHECTQTLASTKTLACVQACEQSVTGLKHIWHSTDFFSCYHISTKFTLSQKNVSQRQAKINLISPHNLVCWTERRNSIFNMS